MMMTSNVDLESVSYLIVISKCSNSLSAKLLNESSHKILPALSELFLNILEETIGQPPPFVRKLERYLRIFSAAAAAAGNGKVKKLKSGRYLIRTGNLKKILNHYLPRTIIVRHVR